MSRVFALTAVLLSIVFVAGCAGTRIPQEPVATPAAFIEAAGRTGEALDGPWWHGFEDKRLDALMLELFKNNYEITQAYERVNQAEAEFRKARALRFPSLSASASGGRTGTGGASSDTFRLSASAIYEVDLWGRLSSASRAELSEALASREDLSAMYISLAARFADLYYLAVEQRAQVELTDFTIRAFEDTLGRVEARYRAGLIPALDVYQSRENLAAARARRPVFFSRLKATEHALAVLLGRFPEQGIVGWRSTLPEPPEFPVGLPSRLVTRRPDIAAAMHRLKARDARVAAAVADRFPAFNLVGEYGGASTNLSGILDSPNILWNALVQAALPVVDAGRRKAEVLRTEAALRESLAAYNQAVLEAFREVEDALSGSRASVERIKGLTERVEAAESSLRLALDRYMQGLSDYLPVLTEQQRLFDARSDLIAAKRTLISDRIGLARALGGGWPEEMATDRLSGAAKKISVAETNRKVMQR